MLPKNHYCLTRKKSIEDWHWPQLGLQITEVETFSIQLSHLTFKKKDLQVLQEVLSCHKNELFGIWMSPYTMLFNIQILLNDISNQFIFNI